MTGRVVCRPVPSEMTTSSKAGSSPTGRLTVSCSVTLILPSIPSMLLMDYADSESTLLAVMSGRPKGQLSKYLRIATYEH
jgi:hypothetical protein